MQDVPAPYSTSPVIPATCYIYTACPLRVGAIVLPTHEHGPLCTPSVRPLSIVVLWWVTNFGVFELIQRIEGVVRNFVCQVLFIDCEKIFEIYRFQNLTCELQRCEFSCQLLISDDNSMLVLMIMYM